MNQTNDAPVLSAEERAIWKDAAEEVLIQEPQSRIAILASRYLRLLATLDAETRRADAEGERANVLGAWRCAECGARFDNAVSPLGLEGVTRCSSCVENQVLQARIAELEALQPLLVAVAGDMEALEKCEDCGDKKANSAQWHDGDEADPFVGYICSTCGCHTWVKATLDEVLAKAQRRNADAET